MRKRSVKLLLLVLTGLFVILSGCKEASLGDVNDEDLFSRVERGEALDTSFEPFISQSHQPEAIGKLLGEDVLTGKWLMHNDEGQVGYSTVTGFQNKNSTQHVQLFAHEESAREPQTVRVKVVKLETNGEDVSEGESMSEVMMEDVVVKNTMTLTTVTIPELEGVYLFRLESLSPSGEVTDRVLSIFTNVLPKLDLALEVKYERGAEATWVVHNHGQTTVTFGVDYALEKYAEGVWRKVPLDLAFIEIAVQLASGESYEHNFSVETLSSGEYRLVKTIHATDYEETFTLQAPFLIE